MSICRNTSSAKRTLYIIIQLYKGLTGGTQFTSATLYIIIQLYRTGVNGITRKGLCYFVYNHQLYRTGASAIFYIIIQLYRPLQQSAHCNNIQLYMAFAILYINIQLYMASATLYFIIQLYRTRTGALYKKVFRVTPQRLTDVNLSQYLSYIVHNHTFLQGQCYIVHNNTIKIIIYTVSASSLLLFIK